ncbi:hypothetical protein KFK09_002303 [Dendrobium nobile]|uniref:Glycosyltransferase family 92 protein n=1 Tax=Dendrobium nobile TaxID=94219 RepID=A0A8T3CDD8_DENNO|nr:hypothetical protein KFK09_002303 [Dendrobium nobile]
MSKAKDDRSLILSFFWNCAKSKLLLTTLFFLPSLFTLFHHLLPSLSSSSCLPFPSSPPPPPPLPPPPPTFTPSSSLPSGAIIRSFTPIGSAAHLFILMGSYRSSSSSFSIIGLSSKPLHIFGKPLFRCEWHSSLPSSPIPSSNSSKLLPDWGFGRIYTVIVLNCSFPSPIPSSGGHLLLFSSPSPSSPETPTITLTESPNQFNPSILSSPPKFDYLYCGSPLFGNLNPNRIREWMAYHALLFGHRSHFVFYDAGGVHEEVLQVIRPWMDKGFLTLQDIRDQEEFDGYYHNQFLVVNDCLNMYRFEAKWIFFFDVDEFVYLQPKLKLDSFMKSMEEYAQFTIEQMPMSNQLCRTEDAGRTHRMWGFEKLVYRDVKRGLHRNRKYAVQPRRAFSAGVHFSQNVDGKTLHSFDRRILYFHYHNTIDEPRDSCRQFLNASRVTIDDTPFVFDDTLRRVARRVKQFEFRVIGPPVAYRLKKV